VRAHLRVLVKRILRKYGYPVDKQAKATQTVLEQAEVLSAESGGGVAAPPWTLFELLQHESPSARTDTSRLLAAASEQNHPPHPSWSSQVG
jgi:Domain of unknown function (DUF3387)